MKTFQTFLLSFAGAVLVSSTALGQSGLPITTTNVLGEWTLHITPVEGQDRIRLRGRDGSDRLDFPLAITSRPDGRLTCTVSDEPAECQVRRGHLRIVAAGGDVTMIYTLRESTRGGFSGVADLRLRGLPFGGRVGSVNMGRR